MTERSELFVVKICEIPCNSICRQNKHNNSNNNKNNNNNNCHLIE